MSRTPYQLERIREALNQKILRPCPVCGQESTRTIYDDYHMLSLSVSPTTTQLAQNVIPCVVVVCSNCGFVELHNVHVLGLAEVLGIPKPGEWM